MGSASSTMSASPAIDQSSPPTTDNIPDPSVTAPSTTNAVPGSSSSSSNNDSHSDHQSLKTITPSYATIPSKKSIPSQLLVPAYHTSASTSTSAPLSGSSAMSALLPKPTLVPIKPPNPGSSSYLKSTNVEDKEEGEISEDEIVQIDAIPIRAVPKPSFPPASVPPRRLPPPPRPAPYLADNALTKNQRKKRDRRLKAEMNSQQYQKNHQHRPPLPVQRPRSPIPSNTPTGPRSLRPIEECGKGREREEEAEVSLELNEPVAPAASDISPDEASQYMEIIRNLIFEGVSPELLVQRGATAKYVMAVCEEIVEGTNKRKALWLETRELPRASSETDSNAPLVRPEDKSPSPDVEITVKNGVTTEVERLKSNGSESSVEHARVERMSAPTDRHPPHSLISQATVSSTAAQPVRIETYKPSQSSRLPMNQGNIPPHAPFHHLQQFGESSKSSHHLTPASLGAPAQSSRQKGKRQMDYGRDIGLNPISNVLLNYDDGLEEGHPSNRSSRLTLSERLESSNRFAVLQAPISTPPFSPPLSQASLPPPEPTAPPPPAPPSVSSEADLQNQLLESRRKALESMRRRRAAAPKLANTILDTTVEVQSTSESVTNDEEADLQKSIDAQMADIEKAVLEAAAAVQGKVEDQEEAEEEMDIDDPEEGEIIPSSTLASTLDPPSTLPVWPISLPIRPPRGVKRLHAEDMMDNRSTSAPARILPPAKRRPFGAAQRIQRLMINIDDSDSDSSDDDREEYNAVFTPNTEGDIIERQRLLEEKEASIQKLKDQIAARMAARLKKPETIIGSVTPMNKTASQGVAEVASRAIGTSGYGEESPMTADIRQLKKELVQAEAEAEAMEVDPVPEIEDDTVDHHELEHRPRSLSPSVIRHSRPSAESSNQGSVTHFTNYQPLLNRYPQLNSKTIDSDLPPSVQVDDVPQISPNSEQRDPDFVDRPLLSSIVLTRMLKANPHLTACQAEMGGGQCADRSCQDLHLGRGIIPTDEDLVEYIAQKMTIGQDKSEAIKVALFKAKKEVAYPEVNLESDQGLSALMVKVHQLIKQ
ncbi:uncharacterized protein IL334_000581 [Kwoniella shivajii]|uniref:Zinc-finger domain-containing protein n=1 Tax=Kwoniella shivajii TaxID=564305 RepID=A0ABZ1CQ14_9TREE|nr:hypothetical protein IL334_000581 [Kwoniella shivajii]